MRRVLWAIAIALFIVIIPLAYGGEATVKWTPPTLNMDGSVIPATGAGSIASTRVEYGSCSGTAFGTKAGEVSANAPATSVVITLAPGTYCFRAYAKNTYGVESAASVAASKVVPAPTPQPPTLTTIDVVAYKIILNRNSVSVAQVGTVPLDIACTPNMSVNGYNVVNRSYVSWTSTQHPSVVVAKCG